MRVGPCGLAAGDLAVLEAGQHKYAEAVDDGKAKELAQEIDSGRKICGGR